MTKVVAETPLPVNRIVSRIAEKPLEAADARFSRPPEYDAQYLANELAKSASQVSFPGPWQMGWISTPIGTRWVVIANFRGEDSALQRDYALADARVRLAQASIQVERFAAFPRRESKNLCNAYSLILADSAEGDDIRNALDTADRDERFEPDDFEDE